MRVPAWRSPPCRGSQAMAMHRGRVIFARFEIVLVLATNAWADTSPSKTAGQGNAATAIAKIYVSAREWDAAKKAWRSPPCRGSQAMAMHRGRVIFARFEIVLVLATNAWADTSPSKTEKYPPMHLLP